MRYPSGKQIFMCFRNGVVNTIEHEGIEHAGYLAFLGLLALFPFLVFFVSMIGFIGGGEMGTNLIQSGLEHLPEDFIEALRPRMMEILSGPPQGLLTLSVLGALWTASSGVEGIRTILNRAYNVKAMPAYWMRRSLSIVQLLFFTFIAIFTTLVVISSQLLMNKLGHLLGIHLPEDMLSMFNNLSFLVLGLIMLLAVNSIYYFIPNLRQPFLSLMPGALLVVLGWWGCGWGLAFYLSHSNQMNVIYGSLGSVIVALLFLYICNMVFIFGAEFNYLLSLAMKIRILPDEEAKKSTDNKTVLQEKN